MKKSGRVRRREAVVLEVVRGRREGRRRKVKSDLVWGKEMEREMGWELGWGQEE